MANVQQIVEDIIANNKVVVFSKSYCPYCRKAKEILKQNGCKDFFVIELDVDDNGAAIQDYLMEKTGQRTVPNIFINQKHIGGCDSLSGLDRQGELKKLLTHKA
ncbi:glutaredoxin [Mycotypha africana]|uniref:glutaredoxin n=1 Tax=Mycotypha africana TaxID=64632 RepID=UPI002300D66E|nr:glutaredoxin [Mycotypha africana]KAI8987487.1 glutaredoxin [Mycotypha africana]